MVSMLASRCCYPFLFRLGLSWERGVNPLAVASGGGARWESGAAQPSC